VGAQYTKFSRWSNTPSRDRHSACHGYRRSIRCVSRKYPATDPGRPKLSSVKSPAFGPGGRDIGVRAAGFPEATLVADSIRRDPSVAAKEMFRGASAEKRASESAAPDFASPTSLDGGGRATSAAATSSRTVTPRRPASNAAGGGDVAVCDGARRDASASCSASRAARSHESLAAAEGDAPNPTPEGPVGVENERAATMSRHAPSASGAASEASAGCFRLRRGEPGRISWG